MEQRNSERNKNYRKEFERNGEKKLSNGQKNMEGCCKLLILHWEMKRQR